MELAITIVSIVHILLSIALVCLILLQSGKTAGLSGAIGGAAESFFGKNKGRTMDAMFSRFTKICAVLFLVTSLFLAYGDSIVDKNEAANAVETIDPASIPVMPEADVTAPAETTPADTTAPADAAVPAATPAPAAPATAAPAAPAATAPAAPAATTPAAQ